MTRENTIILLDMYLNKLITMTGKGITTGESDPISLHVTAVKVKELYGVLRDEPISEKNFKN